MTTNTLASSPNAPGIADVFVYAATHIHQAAGELWPGEHILLESHVPSVTEYVHRVRVGDRALYAKTSFLGMSLVSLLRGAGGPWPVVRQAQQAYLARPDSLPAREAAQLTLLTTVPGPRVCALAGLKSGVVFTEPVSGPALGDVLLARPDDASGLLSRVLTELRPIHRPSTAQLLAPSWDITERGITGTFLRNTCSSPMALTNGQCSWTPGSSGRTPWSTWPSSSAVPSCSSPPAAPAHLSLGASLSVSTTSCGARRRRAHGHGTS